MKELLHIGEGMFKSVFKAVNQAMHSWLIIGSLNGTFARISSRRQKMIGIG